MGTFLGGKVAMVKYSGPFDLYGLYDLVHKWLEDRGFDVHEKVYKHKKSGGAYENERTFIGEKKESEYILYKITVDFKIWTLKTIEVERNGKKEKMQNARIRLIFNFSVDTDYSGEWSKTPFLIKLSGFFNWNVIKRDLLIKHVDKVYYMTNRLQTEVKKHLGMETNTSAY